MPNILETGQKLAVDAALDQVEKDHKAELVAEATASKGQQTLEIGVQGEKGRLSGAAYVKGMFGLTKDYVAGVRGVWSFRKK